MLIKTIYTPYFILSIIFITVIVYYLRIFLNNDNVENIIHQTNLENNTDIKAEVEILNGCGEIGVANLYANFLTQKIIQQFGPKAGKVVVMLFKV